MNENIEFFSIVVILIALPTIFAGPVLVLVLLFLYFNRNEKINIETMKELKYLEKDYKKLDYLYNSVPLINLLYSVKLDLYVYAPKNIDSAINAANNFMRIRKDFDLVLIKVPTRRNELINFEGEASEAGSLEVLQTKAGVVLLENAYQNYQQAENQYNLCINYLNSTIFSIPGHPVINLKFKTVISKCQIIMKRELDFMYNTYNKNKRITDNNIIDYDLQKPFNSSSNSSFNWQI